jgi:hypothetical protein
MHSKSENSPVFREPIQWFETARCLGVTLDIQLKRAAQGKQVGRKETKRLGVIDPLLNKRSGLSI